MPKYLDASKLKIYEIMGYNRNIPQYVYYYCSVETMLSIINNSTLRLSNIEKSNDSNEIKYYCDNLISKANDWLYENRNTFGNNTEIDNRFIENLECCIGKHVCCFTEQRDNIHMWREYGNCGKGVAIKIALRPLFDLYSLDSKFVVGKVSYSTQIINKKFRDFVNSMIGFQNTENIISHLYDFIRNAINAAPFFKQNEHSYEKEWRLLYNPFGNIIQTNTETAIDLISEAGSHIGQTGFLNFTIDQRNGNIRSYFNYDFSACKNNLIREIILGCNCILAEGDVDLLSLLKMNGYNIRTNNNERGVEISRSPLKII